MPDIFFVSDTHWGHSNILNFTCSISGNKVRTFDDVNHMNEHMVNQWNSVVKPNSKVYHLGDVAMNKKGLEYLHRCNGEKVLIRGNHDLEKLHVYQEYFKDVRGCHQFDGMLLTHIPVHPDSLGRWGYNVHGHLHTNRVMNSAGHPDPRYLCVCMEQLDDYTPISLEQLKKAMK